MCVIKWKSKKKGSEQMNKRSTKFYRKNEAEVMKRLGFKPTKNSGAGWVEKCDGQNEQFICELKSTDKESYSLKQQILQTLEYHACVAHKTPVFVLQFLNKDEVWVAITEDEFKEYMQYKMEKQMKDDFPLSPLLEKKDKTNFDFSIDNEEETGYNDTVSCKRSTEKSYLARQAYRKQVEQEMKEQEQKFKQMMKEKRKERRK